VSSHFLQSLSVSYITCVTEVTTNEDYASDEVSNPTGVDAKCTRNFWKKDHLRDLVADGLDSTEVTWESVGFTATKWCRKPVWALHFCRYRHQLWENYLTLTSPTDSATTGNGTSDNMYLTDNIQVQNGLVTCWGHSFEQWTSIWIKVDQLDDTCFIIYCSTCFRR